MNDDRLIFATENTNSADNQDLRWKLLIADDEEEIHNVTKMVLSDFRFENLNLNFLSAYSGEETKKALLENPDVAVILLDVVMETEDSGLEIAKWIREEQKNSYIRIILRTGQPGSAPEKQVIKEYDINDYKEKTELTSQKLYTVITTAIRSFRSLKTIERNRAGLEKIIKASATLFELHSLKQFVSGALTQLTSLIQFEEKTRNKYPSGFAAQEENGHYQILASTGSYSKNLGENCDEFMSKEQYTAIQNAIKTKDSTFFGDDYIGYFKTKNGTENLLYLNGIQNITDVDKDLIRIFSSNVAVAFDNLYLNQEIEETQKEVIITLGSIVESRSKETGNHVQRVGALCELLAKKIGLGEKEADKILLASPMHDVGKIGIPDKILKKPGRLTNEEYTIMKTHTTIGYDILKKSSRPLLKTAAIIAKQHHERWDGKGYPDGISGDSIHIFGRIAAIADVFDALSHNRVYKDAWPIEKILKLFEEERGKQFDPDLIDVFFESLDDIKIILKEYPDY